MTAPQPPKPLRRRFSALMRRSSQVLPSSISEVDVYFGSQSGTASRLAAMLARDVAARGVNTSLQSLEHFDPHRFTTPDSVRANTRASVFVVSTQFAGCAPPNAEIFYEWLKAASNLSSEYLTYNAVGKFVDARLRVLGGVRLCTLGLGDVLANLDVTFLEWRAQFLLLLPKIPGSIRLVALEDELLLTTIGSTNDSPNESAREVVIARIALVGQDLKYEVADMFGFLPHNCAESVEQVAAALDFDLDSWIQLYFETEKPSVSGQQQQQQQLPFSTPCTVRTALSQYLELNTVTREFVRMASGFVSNDSEREFLESLASTDGSADFAERIVRQNRGVLELLSLAPSLRIPFEVFVNIAPLIKPRHFSIATSPLRHPHHIEIAVDLGHPDKKQGVTATFLRGHARQHKESKATTLCMLHGFVVRSKFKPPVDPAAPMVLIADGTGIAPMRALLEHRRAELRDESTAPTSTVPRNLLFYGCSDRASMLFAEDLFAMEQEGLFTLKLAFLSDVDEDSRHVQNVVARHLGEIHALVRSSGDSRIFACGDSAVVKAVHQAFQARRESAEPSSGEIDNWYEKAVESGRFVHQIF